MKLTFPISRFIDDVYADSALNSLLASGSPLSGDQAAALRRMVILAAGEMGCELSRLLVGLTLPDVAADTSDGEIVFVFDDNDRASPAAIEAHSFNALAFATLRLVAIAASDFKRADRYASGFAAAVKAIYDCLDRPPSALRLVPHYC